MNVSILTPETRRYMLTTVMLLIFSAMYAQQFSVQNFRHLPNDISAYIQPVKDLNDEACALIKIVGSRDFAFSTPLGIVKRKNDIGETWIYVPRGTTQITIKHPQWGVLRDYRFPSPLESRLTYELVLSAPVAMPRRRVPPDGEHCRQLSTHIRTDHATTSRTRMATSPTTERESRMVDYAEHRTSSPRSDRWYTPCLDAAAWNIPACIE